MQRVKHKNRSYKKILLVVFVVVVAALLIGFIAKKVHDNRTKVVTDDGQVVELKPATDEEKQQVEDNKQAIVENEEKNKSNQPPAGTKRQVSPVITAASVNGVNGYVTGVFEEGGSCRADFTLNGQSFSKTSTGFQNASYTQCAPISLSSADFPVGGSWTVKLTYTSPTSQGASPAQTFEVTK